MKRIIMFGLAIWAASPALALQPRDVSLSTSKPVQTFVSCFVAAQERASLPWWFVPKEHGGTISNLGAKGAKSAYFVGVSDLGSRRRVQLEFVSDEGPSDRTIAQAVDQCV